MKEKILNGPNMWPGEVNHKYLSQQPSILTFKLRVVSVSFNFRAVSERPFLNPSFIKDFLLVALFISCCLMTYVLCC